MRYLLTYCNEYNDIFKVIKDTAALSIAEVQANLLAYKNKGSVIEVKLFELEDILLKAIKQRSVSMIIDALKEACNGAFSMEQLEDISKEYLIKYELAPISDENEYDSEMWYIIYDYIITFSGSYNAYGTLDLRNITVYDDTDSIIMDKDIEDNKIKKGA